MENLYLTIGTRIKAYLHEQNTSQKDLATKLGLSPQVMNKIINGAKAINAVEIAKIAAALSITTDDLIGEIKPKSEINDPILFMIGKTDNEDTKEKLRFVDHLMDTIIRFDNV